MPFLCDYLGVDSLLDALSYMNAATLARVACTSRMGAVAAHEAQQRPSLLVLKGSLETIAQELKERLVARPTVVFVQYSVGHHDDEDAFEAEMTDFLAKKLPPTTQVLGGSTMSLQCAWFPENHPRPAQTTLDIRNRYDRCEVAILATTLPEASAKAFHLMPMQSKSKADSDDEDTYSEDEVSSCDAEEVEEDGLKEAEGASLAPKGKTQEAAEDPLKELLSLEPPPKVVVVYDADRGSSTARSIAKIQEAYPEAAVIGGVVMGRRILVRGRTSEGSISGGRGVGALAISGNVPLYAMTCPFTGCVATAKQTVANCMSHAQESATAKNESILGALLFTCNARGPHMFGCHAKDAALFQAQFPRAPLMGFYAAGEIGPQVEEEAEHAFLRGNAALQMEAIYTWKDFLDAVCTYNKWADGANEPAFLGDSDVKIKAMTVVGMMANVKVETLHWTACKERLSLPDGSCPCHTIPGCVGGCSSGTTDHYNSVNAAKDAGFTVTTCNGVSAPADGCTDFWGNALDPKDCWYGRGVTQLTWPANYGMLQDIIQKVTGQDLCNNPDFVCNTAENGFVTAIGYWMKNCQEWDASHTFDAALAAIRPANTQANPEGRASFYEWLKALGISPVTTTPKPPMPDEGETQVKAGEGCWQIADRCCDGQGADYATVICDPPACSPGPSAGTTIKYNCKGCN